jgi:hypothetical protein
VFAPAPFLPATAAVPPPPAALATEVGAWLASIGRAHLAAIFYEKGAELFSELETFDEADYTDVGMLGLKPVPARDLYRKVREHAAAAAGGVAGA